MAGIEIGTLRLRGPPHLASRAAFRIEDGLRTELAESRRLVLIRRMRPGRRSVSARPEERSAAIRHAYEAATRDARHGRDAGDGAFVNCVWFDSPAEARRLLLAELLAGRRPAGWFWRMAVPEWRERDLDCWLPEIAERALAGGGDEREWLGLLLFALEESGVDVVARAVAAWAGALASPPLAPAARESGEAPASGKASSADSGGDGPPLRETAAALRSALPAPMRERIESLVRRLGPSLPPVLRLLERLLLQASPSLALAPQPLRKLASAWSELIAEPAAAAPPPPPEASAPPAPRSDPAPVGAPPPSSPARTIEDGGGQPASRTPPLPSPPVEPARPAASPRATAERPLNPSRGPVSEAAGLWLVIPSLIRLGFREWLCERPHLLRQDPGRTLLRTLARHHRVQDEDPALAAFEALDALGETPDWARLWRSGVDGWLRRRAGIPLHRLIRKRGAVVLVEDRLVVRFPLEAADIRLRRRALDVDPGWVDWLGLSVRYRYEERMG